MERKWNQQTEKRETSGANLKRSQIKLNDLIWIPDDYISYKNETKTSYLTCELMTEIRFHNKSQLSSISAPVHTGTAGNVPTEMVKLPDLRFRLFSFCFNLGDYRTAQTRRQRRSVPCFPHAFRHCSCVSKRLAFPPQPPYQKRVQLPVAASWCHLRTNLAQGPSDLGSWQTSTSAESAEKKKEKKKPQFSNQLCEERFYLHLINERYT